MDKLKRVNEKESNKDYLATGITINYIIDKINEIVIWINDHDQIIEYTPEDVERLKKELKDLNN
jgi:archaellum component FlaC